MFELTIDEMLKSIYSEFLRQTPNFMDFPQFMKTIEKSYSWQQFIQAKSLKFTREELEFLNIIIFDLYVGVSEVKYKNLKNITLQKIQKLLEGDPNGK